MLRRLTVDVTPATGETSALSSIGTHGTSTNKQSILEDMHVSSTGPKHFWLLCKAVPVVVASALLSLSRIQAKRSHNFIRSPFDCPHTRLPLNSVTPLAWRLCMAVPIAVLVPC